MGIQTASQSIANEGLKLSFRNLIHNGDFKINQRGFGARSNNLSNLASTGNPTSDGMPADRWNLYSLAQATNGMSSSNVTVQLATDHPLNAAGQSFSISINSNSATGGNVAISNRTTDFTVLKQDLESYNVSHLFNTSSTKKMVLSFWVKSNKTGTYSIEVRPSTNPDVSKIILLPYTINQSGVWEKKELQIPAFNFGTIPLDNSNRLSIQFGLASNLTANHTDGTTTITQSQIDAVTNQWGNNPWGSGVVITNHVNLFDTVNNYWRITDVQLEEGSVATPFERKGYAEELAICQRYCYVLDQTKGYPDAYMMVGQGFVVTTSQVYAFIQFPVSMRVTPTVNRIGTTATPLFWYDSGGNVTGLVINELYAGNTERARLRADKSAAFTVGRPGLLWFDGATTNDAKYIFSSEI